MKRIFLTKQTALIALIFILLVGILPTSQLLAASGYQLSETLATIKISGTVYDGNTGEPLIGATVLIVNSSSGTITDYNGSYEIQAEASDELVFSYTGYQPQTVSINGRTQIDVNLLPDVEVLDQVVVIGYGTVKKSDVTGAVLSVGEETIAEANKVNAVQALQGQVAGVDIQSASNKPGGGFNIRIRGANTVNSNEPVSQGGYSAGQNPLFVVDGVFVDDISFLNPADIAKIDVLKDASATAIYGSRGSSGVVIVTTKRGESGKVTVQYDNYFGLKEAYNEPDIFNGSEYTQFMRDAIIGLQYASGDFSGNPNDIDLGDYLRPNELENIDNNNYADWVDLIQQRGVQTNHSLSISGGTDVSQFGFGAGYTFDEGVFEGEDYERYNLRANMSTQLTPFFKVIFNGYANLSTRNEGSYEGFRSAYRLRPTGSAYDDNGDPLFWPLEGETFITNPLFEADNITRETRTLGYLGNIGFELKPFEKLTFTTTFSPNIEFVRYGEYRGFQSKAVGEREDRRRAVVNNANSISYTWDNILNYSNTFNRLHEFNASLIASSWLQRDELVETQVRNFTTDEFLFYNIDAGSDIRTLRNSFVKESLQSYAARFNYSFNDRYLLTLTGRYDGSSKLSEDNKWAFFPSAALAWRISNEDFWSQDSPVSSLKLRLSYGETGNTGSGGGLAPLGSQSLISSGFTNLGDEIVTTSFIDGLSNQDLTWETTTELNIGLDFGLLNNRITGAIEYYDRNTTDLILQRSLPVVSGFSSVFQNVGEVNNTGVELFLNTVNVNSGDWKWTTSFNFAANQNELVELYDGLDELPGFSVRDAQLIHRVGEEIGSLFFYEVDGVWQESEVDLAQSYGQQPGQVRVVDQNNDGVIDADDRTILGSQQPDWTGSFTSNLSFKNFDFNVFVYTRQGVEGYSWFHRSHGWDQDDNPARFNGWKTDYWTPTNPNGGWHQPGNSGPYKRALNYQDLSFVKVGYITLGYNLPQPLLDSWGISRFRLYATAQNPFVFTDYEGWDPETANRNTWGAGFATRSWIAGVNLTF